MPRETDLYGLFMHARQAIKPDDRGTVRVTIEVGEKLIPTLATFAVDAGIADAPGHVIATLLRDTEGKITGLQLEPI